MTVAEYAKQEGLTISGVHERIRARTVKARKVPGVGRYGMRYYIEGIAVKPSTNGHAADLVTKIAASFPDITVTQAIAIRDILTKR